MGSPLAICGLQPTNHAPTNDAQGKALQSPGTVDCGVWVLAQITAVLHGFERTGLQEHMVPVFRNFLYSLISALPVWHPTDE